MEYRKLLEEKNTCENVTCEADGILADIFIKITTKS